MAVGMGAPAGFAVIAGAGILLYRRIVVPEVRTATTTNDKLMYLLLVGALLTGMVNTLTNVFAAYNYRETVSPWLRSLFTPNPAPELMANAPLSFQVHVLIVLTLLGIWPYTRLVHMFSAPIGYLTRPYVVYRSRDPLRASGNRYAKAWVTPQAPPPRSRWV
jgi:nitrate reductase gamma subunit